jgi:hypothetical protein
MSPPPIVGIMMLLGIPGSYNAEYSNPKNSGNAQAVVLRIARCLEFIRRRLGILV